MTQTPTPPQPEGAEPLFEDRDEALLRTRLYLRQRLNYQEEYYRARIDEFTFNADKMLWVSAGLMGISTVLSSYSVVQGNATLAFFMALLPACATAVAAFRAVYQWQRQASLYDTTWLALQQARLALPDEDFLAPEDYNHYLPQLVKLTEEVLRNEANQWGQLEQVLPKVPETLQLPPTEEPAPADRDETPDDPAPSPG